MKLISDIVRYIFYHISGKKHIPFGYRIPRLNDFKGGSGIEYIAYFNNGYYMPGVKNDGSNDHPVWMTFVCPFNSVFDLPFNPIVFIKKGFVRVKTIK